MNAITKPITLDDKYLAVAGRVYLSGIQALVRLPLDRVRLDRQGNLKTGGFISGYRGSPLAGYDSELERAKKHLKPADIVFKPGVNEELGATAVWGSQKVSQHGKGSDFDGVFGIWYGKAPGVDRAGDVLRQANASGTAAHGGVLALAGDDHLAKSSILPAQSEYFFEHVEMPVFNPSDIQEVLDYGLHGLEMSRFAGLWSGLICLADTMDASATISVDPGRLSFVRPEDRDPRKDEDLNRVLLLGNRMETERLLRDVRIPAAQAYVLANRLDHVAFGAIKPRIGIVATGKAYRDLRQALDLLGIDERKAREIGLAIYKVAMPWPLEPVGLSKFARGIERLLVVEHKRAFMEGQIKDIAYGWEERARPEIWGKKTPAGAPFLSDVLELTVQEIAQGLLRFLPGDFVTPDMRSVTERMVKQSMWAQGHAERAARVPYFCSGCPHSTSTVVPEGARAMPGIGCHAMTEIPGRTTDGQIAMGGEGVLWVGQSEFSNDKHVFVNVGDGTYFHSAILAIRQALSSKVSITYKILYNDAVAMTGGQKLDGTLTVPQLTRQLEAEGVERLFVISDEPEKYIGRHDLAPGTGVAHRDELMRIQKDLQEYSGVSVIVYDQTCAAEKRRRRKRKEFPDPDLRLFINDRVCEACGDCSVQSNCIAVEPVKTEFGEKRRINQSSCNKDFSCVKGFCPSFVWVEGADLRKSEGSGVDIDALLAELPDVEIPALGATQNLLIAGIGGMGVTTTAAVLAMAAHVDGKQASTLDMTGLAQKGGPVTSHVRFAAADKAIEGPRVPTASLDVLLATDMVVATNAEQLALIDRKKTGAFANTRVAPTAEFVMKQTLSFDEMRMQKTLEEACPLYLAVDAASIAEKLLGDAIYANMLLVGMAWQAGRLPLTLEAVETAIMLNGAAVKNNLRAFRAGRILAVSPEKIVKALPGNEGPKQMDLDERIAFLKAELTAYQDAAYAERFAKLVEGIHLVDQEFGPGTMRLTRTIADNLFKVMAYKDEYEVARLYADPEFEKKVRAQFANPKKLTVMLAPPLVSRTLDPKTGRPAKRAFGPWIFTAFRMLAKLKGLRGTALDIFAKTAERKAERALIESYTGDVKQIEGLIGTANYGLLVEIARVPDLVRGFGPIKEANMEKAAAKRADLFARLDKEHEKGVFMDAAE
ncbi:indolepyruvate ferredoxin oxidoreductase family protein [Stappia sp. GBMRC 2046]|uniref:Indolepyruvate ferredoxin oxidoreductase family protein n=1 Tax=Stappia sediminis TaxID=2692190 RepID=A0A7X3LRJ3_9HYPH|nr:indolepyruvate ferredoxin oxidoreductase family protein [Stappia sediminis]MXN63785.1 indolepyruvate ferredoxin oxidoreductase family protein [Stappia sediminis]